MYRSINCLFILLITFLSLKTIQTESVDLKSPSTFKQWWIERHASTPTIIEDNQSETSSLKFCIPFYTCPTDINRTILIILFPIFLLICCCYYHCYEYCKIKHELDQFQQYHHIDGFEHNKCYLI